MESLTFKVQIERQRPSTVRGLTRWEWGSPTEIYLAELVKQGIERLVYVSLSEQKRGLDLYLADA